MSDAACLLVTHDPALVSAVLRLAAAAGTPVEVRGEDAADGAVWSSSAVVLIGADCAVPVASRRPAPREQVHLVGLGAPAEGTLRAAIVVGARSVLELPEADGSLVELLTDAADLAGDDPPGAERSRGRSAGRTVAVVGGSGGAGASVLVAALALTAARDGSVLLVDLDPWGPGLHRVVGIDHTEGVTWADLSDSRGRLGSRSLREALPCHAGVRLLGWRDGPAAAVSSALLREVVPAGQRGHDWVFLDVPRHAEVALDSVLPRCDHVLLVTRATLTGVAAAARVASGLAGTAARVGLVVRTGRGSTPGDDVARALGRPLLAELSHDRRLDEQLDLGVGPVHRRGPVAATAHALVGPGGVLVAGATVRR